MFDVRQQCSVFACVRVLRVVRAGPFPPRCSRRVKSLIDTSACADSEDRPRDGRSEPRRCKSLQFNHSLLKPVYNWAVASCCPRRGQKAHLFKQTLRSLNIFAYSRHCSSLKSPQRRVRAEDCSLFWSGNGLLTGKNQTLTLFMANICIITVHMKQKLAEFNASSFDKIKFEAATVLSIPNI